MSEIGELPTVFLVDDDAALRESMSLLLGHAGFRVRTFRSGRAFLHAYTQDEPGCVVLDLRMPEMSGLEVQEALLRDGFVPPLLFLSGYGDVPTTVRAIKGGAVDFLVKPVAAELLIERIRQALQDDARQRAAAADQLSIRALYAELTAREREVMLLATKGFSNKEIAQQLGISPRTVESHRGRVMEKMGAGGIAELCHMAAACSASPAVQP